MSIKRPAALRPVIISADELLTRTIPFTSTELVINQTTGEMRVGPGLWDDLKTFTGDSDVTLEVRVASTANVAVATALNAADTIDGVTLAAGDLVLLKNQSTPAQNGIYIAGVTPARPASFNTIPELHGILVKATEGSAGAGKLFRSTTAATGTIDSTAVTFAAVAQGAIRFAELGNVAKLPAKTSYSATDVLLLEQADGSVVKMALSDFKTNMA